RGVFVAEGIIGQVAAVARKDASQYAFYRGTTHIPGPQPSAPPVPAGANAPAAGQPQAGKPAQQQSQSLDENLKSLNTGNQIRQIERLQNRYKDGANKMPGVEVQGVK
ncbi:MAG TPA: hypothetical protein VGY53_06045, partial [Isosphaeraceae bacterium]|nr:hypothetical protein [Isosphaeraceae bacterium]